MLGKDELRKLKTEFRFQISAFILVIRAPHLWIFLRNLQNRVSIADSGFKKNKYTVLPQSAPRIERPHERKSCAKV